MSSIKNVFSFSMVGVVSCVMLMGLVALSGCASITGKSTGQTTSDAVISSTVQTKLKNDDHLTFLPPIDVDTERGVVNLTGVVPTDFQRARAARLAQEVEGVTSVNNKLRVRPWLFRVQRLRRGRVSQVLLQRQKAPRGSGRDRGDARGRSVQ